MLIGYDKQWEFLKNKFESSRLSHAYLFTGEEGIGKKLFAKEFIKFVNCLPNAGSRPEKPCQNCANCGMVERESFPDLKVIKKNLGKGEIGISQIREAQKFLSYKSYYGFLKALVVDGADKMNQEAQSCFLKTLEEPKGKTILFLIVSKPDILLPTIRSRCQVIRFLKPANFSQNTEKSEREKKILKELSAVMGLDLSEKFKYVKSLSAHGNPASGADYAKQEISEIIEVLQKHFRRLLLNKILSNSDMPKKYSVSKIKQVLKLTEEIGNKLNFTNANPKLALEVLLMEL